MAEAIENEVPDGHRNAEQILLGANPEILEGIEHERAIGALKYYATLSRFPATIRERAQAAVEQLEDSTVSHLVHFYDPIDLAIEAVEGQTTLRCTSVSQFTVGGDEIVAVSAEADNGSIGFSAADVARVEGLDEDGEISAEGEQ